MQVEIRYSEREYLEAVQVARTRASVLLRDSRKRYRGFIPGILKTIAVLTLLAALVLAGRADPTTAVVGMVLVLVGLAAFAMAKPLIRHLAVPPLGWRDVAPHTYEITDAGLRHDSCGESVIWSWQSIRQIDRHFGFVLIVLDTDVLALPENQFPTVSAVSDFVSELRRRIPGGEVQACPSPWGPR